MIATNKNNIYNIFSHHNKVFIVLLDYISVWNYFSYLGPPKMYIDQQNGKSKVMILNNWHTRCSLIADKKSN